MIKILKSMEASHEGMSMCTTQGYVECMTSFNVGCG